MIAPLRPEHADRTFAVKGAPGLTGQRHLAGYAYPANGNVHNPTPRYRWNLLAGGRLVDSFASRGELVAAALDRQLDYLDEVRQHRASTA